MSGHNKWSKIKKGKEIKDKQKGNIFSKLSRLITLAVFEGGGIADPENNVKLRLAIEKAKNFNLPKDNIQRAIEKGTGPGKQELKEIVYEAFSPVGTGLVILATTDNSNRTLSEIRSVVETHGGKLGNLGSVMYLFKKCGLVSFKINEVEERTVFEFADKIKAFDIDKDEESYYVYFPYEHLGKVKETIGNLTPDILEVDYKPISEVELKVSAAVKKEANLIDALEILDEVHKVFSNAKF